MGKSERDGEQGQTLSRRDFLGTATGGTLALAAAPGQGGSDPDSAALARQAAKLPYLTPVEHFQSFVREKPSHRSTARRQAP